MTEPIYVYLIGSRTYGWYKIGKAKNVSVRLKEIGILLPFKVEAIAAWAAWSGNVEATLHKKYKDNRIHGEWFKFTEKELQSLLETPVDNATMLNEHSAVGFKNMERDCEEGRHVKVEIKRDYDPILAQQYILARKLKQAFGVKHLSSVGEVVGPL
jgi:hypothetical protein